MNPRFFLLFKRHLPEMVKIWDRKRRGCENEIARFRTESGYGEGEAGRNSPEEKLEGILGGLFKGSIVLGVGHDVGFEELNFVSNWIHLFKSIQTEESLYFLSTYILMELISTDPKNDELIGFIKGEIMDEMMFKVKITRDIFDFYAGVHRLDELLLVEQLEYADEKELDKKMNNIVRTSLR